MFLRYFTQGTFQAYDNIAEVFQHLPFDHFNVGIRAILSVSELCFLSNCRRLVFFAPYSFVDLAKFSALPVVEFSLSDLFLRPESMGGCVDALKCHFHLWNSFPGFGLSFCLTSFTFKSTLGLAKIRILL